MVVIWRNGVAPFLAFRIFEPWWICLNRFLDWTSPKSKCHRIPWLEEIRNQCNVRHFGHLRLWPNWMSWCGSRSRQKSEQSVTPEFGVLGTSFFLSWKAKRWQQHCLTISFRGDDTGLVDRVNSKKSLLHKQGFAELDAFYFCFCPAQMVF